MMPAKDGVPAPAGSPPPAPGKPNRFGTSGDFRFSPGARIDPHEPSGYYIDLRSKAVSPEVPPRWWKPESARVHVVLIQWGLGCHERFLAGDGERWLEAARWAADRLLESQEQTGRWAGGWVHRFPYKHTYRLEPPWLSGMAQGQGASLLVRIHRSLAGERYAAGALAAIEPMRKPPADGGVAAILEGGRIPEEFPTDPPSHVLNGAIYAIWGTRDVAVGLDDREAHFLASESMSALASALHRYDTGSWSRYDLYPHPIANLASPMYHRLHVAQLQAMAQLSRDGRFEQVGQRFADYLRSPANVAAAYARKVVFRALVPRNRWLALRLPWAGGPRR